MAGKKTAVPDEELANDPSLRWFPYKEFEALWSDGHGGMKRFVRYEGGRVVLAELGSMRPLPGAVGKLTVRRYSGSGGYGPLSR